MINYTQAIILGLLQGATELFPISSLGHSVILPKIFGWSIDQKEPFFLTFLVATHLATATVLVLFFGREWTKIIQGMWVSLQKRQIDNNHYAKLGWLIVLATIPAGILGLLLEDRLKILFANPTAAAIFLILNGLLLGLGELLRRRSDYNHNITEQRIAHLSYIKALVVGSMQAIALLPGFSRTGATLVGGLITGLNHQDAARFSFLLATPIIAAAAVLKLPELFFSSQSIVLGPILVGSAASALAAWLSVKFLTRYFETNKLWPFAIYCFGGGIIYFIILNLH